MKEKSKKTDKKKVSRRDFIKTAAVTGLSFTIVPRHVLGGVRYVAPSEKMNIAGVGIGGMGKSNIMEMAKIKRDEDNNPIPVTGSSEGENIVALCDVDDNYSADTYKLFPKAKRYHDFREMLEKQKDIDGVLVATPDHTHAVIAMAAINMGKHVYVQKPITYTVKEARMLTEAARKAGVATQMGNQGRSGEGVRLMCEWIWDGAIGDVTEVDTWTNRPIWPQGMPGPTDTPPVPKGLDWDLWIGPAPMRPYHPDYHPRLWRGYWDFGTGALGDMACHIMDPVFWALKLKYPTSFEASVSCFRTPGTNNKWAEVVDNKDTYPRASKIHYQFPSREGMPPVKLTWYDGGLLPRRPDDIEEGRRLGDGGNGVIFHGTKGKIMCGCYGISPRLIPETAMKAYKRPPKTIERIEGSHEQNWIEACKGGKPACSNFEYSGPLTESVLAGNLAMRFPGEKLEWDGDNMKVTNNAEADAFVHRQYRHGWNL